MSIYKKLALTLAVFAVLGGAFLISAPTAKALTVNELQAQIDALLRQITALQAQLAKMQGTTAWCHDFNRNLKYGMAGTEVKALQLALGKEGDLVYDKNTNGVFDEYCASVVVGFQEKYASEILIPWGLAHGTGFVGKTTRAKLNELYRCKAKPSITVLSPNGGEELVKGQTYQIQWTSQNVAPSRNVQIELTSTTLYRKFIAKMLVLSGSYSWTIPSDLAASDKYSLSVTCYECYDENNNRVVADFSDNYFSIVEKPTPSIGVPSPNLGDIWQMGSTYNISWFANNLASSDKINIILLDGRAGYSYYVIATDVPALAPSGTYAGTPIGTYSWTVPATGIIPSSTNPFKIYIGKYKPPAQSGDWEPLRVSAESVLYGYGNSFSIVSASAKPIINSISPNSILQGQTLQVAIYGYNLSGGDTSSCGINPSVLGGFILGNCNIQPLFISVSITASNNVTPGQRQITVITPSGTSNAVTFTVLSSSVNRSIKVLSPNGGENWQIGQTYRIKWDSQGVDKVAIYVYNDTIFGSGSTNYLDSAMTSLSVPAAQGYFDWTIVSSWLPKAASGNEGRYKIRIDDVNVSATGVRDSSDNYFSIVEAVTCADSDGGKDYYVRGKATGLYSPDRYAPGVIPPTGYIWGENPNKATMRVDESLDYNVHYDHCFDSETSKQLNEGYCTTDGYLSSIGISCPYGCQDGACLVSPPPEEPKPDLTVISITWTPLNPKVGEEITFYSTIKNIGKADVSRDTAYWVCDYIDGKKINCNFYYSSLGIDKTQTITWSRTPNWPAEFSSGDHTFMVMADDNKVVDEILENNNSLTKTFTVLPLPPPPPEVLTAEIKYSGTYEMTAWPGDTVSAPVFIANKSSEEMILTEVAMGNPAAKNDFLNYIDSGSFSIQYVDSSGVTKTSQLRDGLKTLSSGYRLFNIVPSINLAANTTVTYLVSGKLKTSVPVNSFQITFSEFSGYGAITSSPVKSTGTLTGKINISSQPTSFRNIEDSLASIYNAISSLIDALRQGQVEK